MTKLFSNEHIAIVFLPAKKWLNILGTDHFYFMPQFFKFPMPVKCSRACFNANQVGGYNDQFLK
ncbi:hypothetical protein HA38_15970 [Pantoea allii]|nr:hypothetical protein HA38_15970 [Pantoea allii]